MPKFALKISQDEIRNLPVGLHATGWTPGLCVRVYESGNRNYFFRYRLDGKIFLKRIGKFPIYHSG